jgi:L-serine dehydratase
MNTSLFELFKIGIGPSSSHTVGPMKAALRFAHELWEDQALLRFWDKGHIPSCGRIQVELYGSLAHTGHGHATDTAILFGLSGLGPSAIVPEDMQRVLEQMREHRTLFLAGLVDVPFDPVTDLLFLKAQMYPPGAEAAHSHPNGMRFTAFGPAGEMLTQKIFYSVGGGFILSAAELAPDPREKQVSPRTVPYPFRSAANLLSLASAHNLTIAELVLRNECALLDADLTQAPERRISRPGLASEPVTAARNLGAPSIPAPSEGVGFPSTKALVEVSILALWEAMQGCVERGLTTSGILPGGLNVRRRAPRLFERAHALDAAAAIDPTRPRDPLAPLDWVSLYAIAVNEENAAGGRVVTAPTNGAAGVIPAIASYYLRFVDLDLDCEAKQAALVRFFLTAAAIGILYKENASISGAEVGCQGEVGVACSMAAAGLVAALNGTNAQVEHAAEIAMEHNLGMTCDPIGGLVQIPCIERNAMGAVKAVNACRMAMHETEGHKLSLDQVIETMYRTGLDMQSRYKETSQAGLALNIIEC